jgi:phage portal protein BeeE
MTYSNVSSLFDFHDRASLRPKANAVMTALSGWALPRGQSVELNRDEYSRPAIADRAAAYKILSEIGVMSVDEIRTMERLQGEAPRLPDPPEENTVIGAEALTGGQT